jgi:hypothetical protein
VHDLVEGALIMDHHFTATPHSTAEDKEKFFKHFLRFVASGYKYTLFHKWFYVRLSMTFGHIAHYNKDGFYREFFGEPESVTHFWKQTMGYGCYGHPQFTYCDVEKAIQAHYRKEFRA